MAGPLPAGTLRPLDEARTCPTSARLGSRCHASPHAAAAALPGWISPGSSAAMTSSSLLSYMSTAGAHARASPARGLGRPQKLSRSRFICPWISVTSRKGSSGHWEKVRNRASAIGRLLFWAGAQVKMERLSEVIFHDPGFVKCLRKRGQTRSVAYLSDNRRIRPRGARWAG